MKIKKVKIDSLIAYTGNAKDHPPEQVKKISASIKTFGFNVPLLIDSKNEVIAGHGRLLAARELGLTEVPCICMEHLSESQIKAFRIADNKVAESGWLDEELQKELKALDDVNFDLKLTGLDSDEIDTLLKDLSTDKDEDAMNSEEKMKSHKEPVTKQGDIWLLGQHRLLCGDSAKNEDVERLINGQVIDMVLTDPPYGMNLNTDYSHIAVGWTGKVSLSSSKKYAPVIGDDREFNPSFILNSFKSCKEIFLWGGDYYSKYLDSGAWFVWDKTDGGRLTTVGSEFELCWSKEKHKRTVIRQGWAGCMGLQHEDMKKRIHPTQKPVSLSQWFLERFSKESALVWDGFLGSGSTLIACEKTGRICYGMEIMPEYCDVIIKRWEEYTGKKAERAHG